MKSMRNNTYTQIHIQLVFAVQNRGSLILDSWRERLYKYMIAIIQNNRHKVLSIGGTADHVHILIGMRPSQSLSDLMQHVKGCSSKWINENRLANGWFSWQEGMVLSHIQKMKYPPLSDISKTRRNTTNSKTW